MDLNKMIAELQAEKERLDQAILALERLVASKGKSRGRAPKLLADHPSSDNGTGEPVANSDGAPTRTPGRRN